MRRLIQNRAWFEVARTNGALASNEEFTLAIMQNDPNFSRAGFKEWIERQGFTESQYAELVQSEVSGFKLNSYIQKLAYVPSYEKKIDHLLKETKIELAYLKIDRDGSSFGTKIDSKKIDEFLTNESAKKQVENYYTYSYNRLQTRKSCQGEQSPVDTSKRSQREADKKAEKLRKKLSDKKNKIKAFADLVVKETDEPNGKAKKGDLGFLSKKNTDVPAELIEAALKLKNLENLAKL